MSFSSNSLLIEVTPEIKTVTSGSLNGLYHKTWNLQLLFNYMYSKENIYKLKLWENPA